MINIIENFLDINYQNNLEDLITEAKLSLYFNESTIYCGKYNPKITNGLKPDNNTKETPQFTHLFVTDEKVNSEYWNHVSPIIYFAMAKCGVGNNMVIKRAKLNFQLKDSSISQDQYNTPHIDQPKGITGIYYINDCDGSTVFFDESGNIIQEIQAKKGTFVYFDSSIYHAGKPAKKSEYKSAINFNWQ